MVIGGGDGLRFDFQRDFRRAENALFGSGVNTAGAVMPEPEVMKIGVAALLGKIDAQVFALINEEAIAH